MNDSDVTQVSQVTAAPARRACLVDGCSCKDPRILSTRRAAYVAALARSHGETALRVITVEPDWRLPSPTDG